MATLWIAVFEGAAEVAMGDPLEETTVNIGATSTPMASAITGSGRKRRRVRLFADADCHVTWAASPTASTGNLPLGSENPEYFDIEAGHKVAVIERV